ncbi:MAG: nucleotidyltransferase family protein [Actinomycetaceae bacterium]|nr:nucleotidyltransferase family protein [Actinomycetaceae bacterium]MDU0969806.1 nucleotidyltransferase family protein [Actinomycetaceae bacterium]
MSDVTKAIILARGLGTRMRKHSDDATLSAEQQAAANAGTKGLINVGRPFLDYILSALADVGVTDICLVIGPEHNAFRDYYDSLDLQRVRIHYAIQEKPLGTADALAAAREFQGDDRAIVLNSDNYYPPEGLAALVACPGSALVGFERDAMVAEGNIAADRIKAFAVVDVEGEGDQAVLKGIVEKPDDATLAAMADAPVSMNCWLFTAAIQDECAKVTPSPRGELELIDAVAALAKTEPIRVVRCARGVLDMSNQDDIPAVAAALKGVDVRL